MLKVLTLLFFTILSKSQADTICKNPEVKATSYTSTDSTILTEIAFIAEFTLNCQGQTNASLHLYAAVGDKILTVAKVVDTVDKYQISWTEELKKAHRGEYKINLYDEEGYINLRKNIRLGDDPSSVKPLVTILLNYPGAYQGPWVNSEFLAVVIAIGVFYFAFSSKSKLVS